MPRELVPTYFPDLAISNNSEYVPLDSQIDLRFRYGKRFGENAVVLDYFKVGSDLQGNKGPYIRGKLTNEKYRVAAVGKGIRRPPKPLTSKDIDNAHGIHFIPHLITFASDREGGNIRSMPLDTIFLSPFHSLRSEIEENLKYLGPLREKATKSIFAFRQPYNRDR